MKSKLLATTALVASVLAGCATTPVAQRTDCFNPSHIRDFQVVAPGVVHVHSSTGSWEVVTTPSCPGLANARSLAFTDRPVLSSWHGASTVPRWHLPPWYSYGYWDHRFATPVIEPSRRVCDAQGDRIVPVWPRPTWGFPRADCKVLSVRPLLP